MFLRLATILTNLFSVKFEGAVNAAIASGIQGVAKRGRQTLLIIMTSFILSVLLSAGIVISILEASSQIDIEGIIYFSSMLTWSLALSGFSLLGLIIIFWPRNTSTPFVVTTAAPLNPANQSSQLVLEELLAALVAEGIHYFKEKNHNRNVGHA